MGSNQSTLHYGFLAVLAMHTSGLINKFDPKSLLCVFLGYNERYKGYRCYHSPTGCIYINRHVLFDEERLPFQDTYSHLLSSPSTPLSTVWRLQYKNVETEDVDDDAAQTEDVGRSVHVPVQVPTQSPAPATERTGQVSPAVFNNSSSSSSGADSDLEQPIAAPILSPPPPTNSHKMTMRAKVGVMKPNPRYALITVKSLPQIPRSTAEVLSHPG